MEQRNRLAGRVAALLLLFAVVVGSAFAATTAAKSGKSRAERIKLGERLTYVGGCNDCHTPGTFYGNADAKRRLSGSELGWEGPWGVTYPRNLTPDKETGIGNWTEEDIVRAIRTGQRPDKSPLLPPMPWPMYAHMTDEEAYAVAAYLKSIPPVWEKAFEVNAADNPAVRASCVEFVLAGLYAMDRISRAQKHGKVQYEV